VRVRELIEERSAEKTGDFPAKGKETSAVSTTRRLGENLRVALVGCGRISAYHVAAIKAIPGADLVAVCDLDDGVAREAASQYGIRGCYTDVESMLRELRPDVVHLLTPPKSHLALARIATKYRAHLYIEKPLASSLADAEAIAELAREGGVQVCPGHSRLFDPVFVEACRRIRCGDIGRVISIRAEQGFTYEAAARSTVIPWSYSYDWGTFDNLICHPLYLACHLLTNPGRPQVVGFNLGAVREAGVEEIRVLIPSSSGIGEVSLSLCNSPEVNRIEVVGTRGRITADWQTMTVLTMAQSGLPSALVRFTANFAAALDLTRAGVQTLLGIARGKIRRYQGLRTIIEQFYGSLREGLAPPVQLEDGLQNVRLMDQIKEACRDVQKQRSLVTPQTATARPRVLVTGATGFLGGRLVEVLSEQGTAARAATRLASRARPLTGIEWVQCDLAREDQLLGALCDVDTVFHCAALCGAPGSLREFEEANVEGTLRLLRLAGPAGVKTFIYVSSMSVYAAPKDSNAILDETAPFDDRAAERGAYTRSKLAADRAVLDYARRHRWPRIVVLRPGTIYGPGATLPLGRFRLPSSNQRPLIAGSPRIPAGLVYVDDVVRAMLKAALTDLPSGSTYNLVDSPECDQAELARTLHEVSDGKIRPRFAPYPLLWTAMLGVDLVSLARNRKLGTARYRLQRTLAPMRFDCAAAKKDLNWHPRVSLAEGLARVLNGDARHAGSL
jgi:nucleoside-diphosphate-sugar epimerase/predicted dehydrogenase